jgi:hypothetical protein
LHEFQFNCIFFKKIEERKSMSKTKKYKVLSVNVYDADVLQHMRLVAEQQHSDISAVHRQALEKWHLSTIDEFQSLVAHANQRKSVSEAMAQAA